VAEVQEVWVQDWADRAAGVRRFGSRTGRTGAEVQEVGDQVQAVSSRGGWTRRRNRRRWASDRHVDRNCGDGGATLVSGVVAGLAGGAPGGRGEPTEEELLGILEH